MFPQWEGFKGESWKEKIDVRNFIQKNYKLYEGDSDFLAPISDKTSVVWGEARELIIEEIKKGIIDIATDRVSGIDNFEAGYIDKDNEVIVGLQTDAPLKRIVNPFGGMRMVKSSCEAYGYELDKDIEAHFSAYRKTHNQ